MSDEASAPAGGEAVTTITLAADAPASFSSVAEASRHLTEARNKPKDPPAESAPAATAEPELAQANADPETAPSEEPNEAEPAEAPPIDPPRSWTQAEKERFQSLPRETQEYLHTREQEREREFRRSQNEIAEERKAAKAEREAAEKVRQQYEAKLPEVMQTIQETGPFSDIRSMADLEKLQAEDPFRFQAYQLHQWKIQAAQSDLAEAEKRRSQEQHSQWTNHVQKENELAAEYIPELADKDKGPALTKRVATELLPELGFKPGELDDLASGKQKLSIYDHRVQRLLADAVKLRDIQSAKTIATAKPLPPVQRPGARPPPNSGSAQNIQALQSQLDKASGLQAIRLAAQLTAARRKA